MFQRWGAKLPTKGTKRHFLPVCRTVTELGRVVLISKGLDLREVPPSSGIFLREVKQDAGHCYQKYQGLLLRGMKRR